MYLLATGNTVSNELKRVDLHSPFRLARCVARRKDVSSSAEKAKRESRYCLLGVNKQKHGGKGGGKRKTADLTKQTLYKWYIVLVAYIHMPCRLTSRVTK
jgi:hypothetical protein